MTPPSAATAIGTMRRRLVRKRSVSIAMSSHSSILFFPGCDGGFERAAARQDLAPARIAEPDREACGDEEDDEALYGTDHRAVDADGALHELGAGPEAREEQRGDRHQDRIGGRHEGDDDAVEAIAGAEHMEEAVFDAEDLEGAGEAGKRAACGLLPTVVTAKPKVVYLSASARMTAMSTPMMAPIWASVGLMICGRNRLAGISRE